VQFAGILPGDLAKKTGQILKISLKKQADVLQ